MRQQSGTTDTQVRAYETEHRKVALKAAREGIVLLQNDGILPLEKGQTIGLFGSGARKTVKGGTGSGDVNERETVSIEKGVLSAGFQIADSSWMDTYDEVYQNARQSWKELIEEEAKRTGEAFVMVYFAHPFENPAENLITEEMAKGAKTAVYVVSRISGEGIDRRNQKGDFCLSDEELKNLNILAENQCDIILVLNTGGLVDVSFIDDIPQIRAVVYCSQGGMEGGTAFGELLCGEVVPSGKLSDSWANHYEDYPCADTFGSNNGDVEKEYYKEGIFVGYRWFDANKKAVRYPFGFGLSYTEFAVEAIEVKAGKGSFCVQTRVTNTGSQYAGKEVVQVYVSAPQIEGMTRECKKLVGFAKTELLQPRESAVVSCEIAYRELARFDEENAVWVVDAGQYGIGVGVDAGHLQAVASLMVEENCVLEQTKHICPVKDEAFEEWKLCSNQMFVNEEQESIVVSKEQIAYTAVQAPKQEEELEKQAEVITEHLSVEQMIELVCGRVNKGDSALGAAAFLVPGAAGETVSFSDAEMELKPMILADGPAGVRLSQHYQVAPDGTHYPVNGLAAFENGLFVQEEKYEDATVYYQYCTAFPIGTMLAQTWNRSLVEEVGQAVGEEMREFGIALWLAPGMNIHRNPLCGRNFEYYSEDPVLSGAIAAAMTKGVQSKGINGTTIKHFACNNQEDNRLGVDSIVSERALREIYLKGFEIAVKESQPFAIMTSYNLVNGVHSANNMDLCTEVARKEWGFEGLIMTDWTTTVNGSEAYLCIHAGNDLIMPGMECDHENIRTALQEGTLSVDELKTCVYRIVKMALKTAENMQA